VIAPALVMHWMLRLDPKAAVAAPDLAEGIAEAASDDRDPIDAASILVSLAFHESHFRLDAISADEDPALAFGAFQISPRWLTLPASASMQARTALMLVRDSQKRCQSLAQYTSGFCDRGLQAARARQELADKIKRGTYVEPNDPGRRAHRRVDEQEWLL
jgi:hypothetical protein